MCVLHICEGQRAISTAKGMVFWIYWPGPLWKPSSSSEALEDNELLDAWPLYVGQSGCRRDTPGSSSKPPSSSEKLSLEAPASSLSLSQTSSDIQFGDRNPAVLAGALMTDCWLRNEYSVRLITQVERVVTNWNAILFQLSCGSIFYRPVSCLFLYTKLVWNYNHEWSVPIRNLQFSILVGKCVTSQCGQ